MTVAELIEKLSAVPGDTPLYIRGYEGGLEDLSAVKPLHVKRDANTDEYGGPHVEIDPADSWEIEKYGQPDHVGLELW